MMYYRVDCSVSYQLPEEEFRREFASDIQAKSDEFFRKLRAGDRENILVWQEYLENLAIAIGSLYAVLDCEMILGGSVAACMTEGDLLLLRQMIRKQSIYAPVSDFIRLGHSDIDICSCGASITYIADFLESL